MRRRLQHLQIGTAHWPREHAGSPNLSALQLRSQAGGRLQIIGSVHLSQRDRRVVASNEDFAQCRRTLTVDCRRLTEDRLFVIAGRQWFYSGPADPEFDDDVTHGEYQMETDGSRGGGATYLGAKKNPDTWLVMAQPPDAWLDAPAFGEAGRLIQAFPEHFW